MSRSNSSTFIDDAIRFPRETHAALREFARSKPWRGTRAHRIKKFRAVHAKLCKIYSVDTRLKIVGGEDRTSSASFYRRRDNSVVLVGRLSVVTYLQMFAGSRSASRAASLSATCSCEKPKSTTTAPAAGGSNSCARKRPKQLASSSS